MSEAYSVLSDKEKKQQYDRFGKQGIGGNGGPNMGNVNPHDIFNIFGGNDPFNVHMGNNFGGANVFRNGSHVRFQSFNHGMPGMGVPRKDINDLV